MAITALVRKWGIRLFKTVWFICISIIVGRTLGPAERYLDHDVVSSICNFIYGNVNAETIYDTYTNIDILIVLALSTVIYRLTKMLLNKIRK
ncbi:hypothetical protein DN595_23660 [Enterobacter cloacae]|uniref:DUF2523 domain-containing protein n=1 Tax=Enterobacter cloacae TaxID=550 RepID=A0AB37VC39_ENTCL|nr:hypothetical protein DN595_23660 [Enterobacter cloacae]